MKLLKFEEFLNEEASQGFVILKAFMSELLNSFFTAEDVFYDEELDKEKGLDTFIAEFTRSILLDVVSGNREVVLVYPERLAKETGKSVTEIKRTVENLYSKYTENIKKSTRGSVYVFSFKKTKR